VAVKITIKTDKKHHALRNAPPQRWILFIRSFIYSFLHLFTYFTVIWSILHYPCYIATVLLW